MDKKYLITALIVIAILGAGYYFYSSKNLPTDNGGQAANDNDALLPPKTEPEETRRVIKMDANGFSPANLTVEVGETVVFKNEDARDRWPASALHPIHQVCPDFDAKKPVKPGEEYSHTFIVAKECPLHDHLIPSFQGKITITE